MAPTFIHIAVTRRPLIFSCAPEPIVIWRRRTSVRAIPASPNEGMESTDVDEVNAVCGCSGGSRCDERHGRSRFRGVPVLRSGGIAAGLRKSFRIYGATSHARPPRHFTELHEESRSARKPG